MTPRYAIQNRLQALCCNPRLVSWQLTSLCCSSWFIPQCCSSLFICSARWYQLIFTISCKPFFTILSRLEHCQKKDWLRCIHIFCRALGMQSTWEFSQEGPRNMSHDSAGVCVCPTPPWPAPVLENRAVGRGGPIRHREESMAWGEEHCVELEAIHDLF